VRATTTKIDVRCRRSAIDSSEPCPSREFGAVQNWLMFTGDKEAHPLLGLSNPIRGRLLVATPIDNRYLGGSTGSEFPRI
jgi:hypothetical protein